MYNHNLHTKFHTSQCKYHYYILYLYVFIFLNYASCKFQEQTSSSMCSSKTTFQHTHEHFVLLMLYLLITCNPGLLKELTLWSCFQMVIPFAVAVFGIYKCKCVTDIFAIIRVLFFSTVDTYQGCIICLSMLILCVLPLPLLT